MTDYTVGDKVTIRSECAYRFGGAVGDYARRGVVGAVYAVYQHRSLGLLHKVNFPPFQKNGPMVWTELRADEMNRAEAGAD